MDDSCINCGASRHIAPDVFGDNGRFAYVRRQPASGEEQLAAGRAMVLCPTASIGTRTKRDLSLAVRSFPLELTEGVFLNGFNHPDSFGAHSYLFRTGGGNWMVDAPRFAKPLVRRMEELGGVAHIFLTHRDDVGDARLFAEHFGARRIIHARDRDAQPDAELVIQAEPAVELPAESGVTLTAPRPVIEEGDVRIFFAPGHTRGSMILLLRGEHLFTGDHFAFLPERNRFGSFRRACWYSWDVQIGFVAQMAHFAGVTGVFPGHGKWAHMPQGEFPAVIRAAVERMRGQ